MTPDLRSAIPLAHLELGDLVTLPNGRSFTVRCRVDLATPVRSVSGFVVAGECSLLLTAPTLTGGPVGVYVPGRLDPAARSTSVDEGATRYWAPHLPGITGAMGELLWRVLTVEGVADPVVVVFRNNEAIPFLRSADALPADVHPIHLRRDAAVDVDVNRHASVVVPTGASVPSRDLYREFVRPA